MICIPSRKVVNEGPEPWHAKLLEMLPAIRRRASLAFWGFPRQTREDLIEEVVANAVVAVKSLYDKGKLDLAYPSVLASFAIRQVRDGRRVGVKLNVKDISSEYCQRAKGISLKRLDRFNCEDGEWVEVLVEDRQSGPAEVAAARIDIDEWFQRLSYRDQQIATALATGSSTGEVARKFQVSAGRISQKRREYSESWREFQGQETSETRAA